MTKAKAETVEAGMFSLVEADASALRSAPYKYRALVDTFVSNSTEGMVLEVRNNDGADLSKEQVVRMYNGVRNYLRYHAAKGTDIPVEVRRASGKMFLIRK